MEVFEQRPPTPPRNLNLNPALTATLGRSRWGAALLCTYQWYPGGRGVGGGGDFDKAFIPKGVAFDFME